MQRSRSKRISCYIIAFVFVAAGLLHFARPSMYVAIMPSYIPFHWAMVYISGVFEILGGLGVLWHGSRHWAGYGLAVLLVAVFPANIHMALHPDPFNMASWLLWFRLPLQFVLIVWVLWATRSTTNHTSPPVSDHNASTF